MKKLKKLDKFKIVNLKRRRGIVKKYIHKVKIVEHCDSIISKIPILIADSHIGS